MKREIKFRGKRIDTGEWVYGHYYYKIRTQQHVIHLSEYNGVRGDQEYEVIPETVGQFTGLHDKNGKEIYEGDIVNVAAIYHGKPIIPYFFAKIVYNDYIGAWQISYLNINNHFVTDDIGLKYELEVIGNIYETPELLNS